MHRTPIAALRRLAIADPHRGRPRRRRSGSRSPGSTVTTVLARGPPDGGRPAGARPRRARRRDVDLTPAPSTSAPASMSTAVARTSSPAGRWSSRIGRDGRLYRLDPGSGTPVAITPDGPYRYADLRLDADPSPLPRRPRGPRRRRPADCRDRRRPARRRAVAAGPRRGPRLPRVASPVARRNAAGLARVGPPRHAMGRDATACGAHRRGRHAWPVRPGRRRPRRVHRPARVGTRRRAPLRQRPERLVEPVPAGRRARA